MFLKMKSVRVRILVLLLLAVKLIAALPFNPKEPSKFSYLGQFSNIISGSHHSSRVRRSSDTRKSTTPQQQSFYFRSQSAAGWSLAASDCKAFLGPSATLLFIETKEELANVTNLIQNSDDTASLYWIGGKYDSDQSRFVWDNGEEIDSSWVPWKEGHPNTRTPVTRVAASTVGSIKFVTQFNTEIARYICEIKSGESEQEEEDRVLSCKNKNDLIILLDSSGSIGKEHYNIALEFSSRLATAWVTNIQNRVSFIIYSNSAHVIIPLEHSHLISKQEIRRKIRKAPYMKARTASNVGLDLAYRQLNQSSQSDVPQNVLLLTDGTSTWPTYTRISAEILNRTGIKTFSIGIGGSVSGDELLAIAGNNTSHVFNVSKYQDLLELLEPVSRRVCGENN